MFGLKHIREISSSDPTGPSRSPWALVAAGVHTYPSSAMEALRLGKQGLSPCTQEVEIMQAPVHTQAEPPPAPPSPAVNPSQRLPGSELCSYQLRSLLQLGKPGPERNETRACEERKFPHLSAAVASLVSASELNLGCGSIQPLGMTAQRFCSRPAGPLQLGPRCGSTWVLVSTGCYETGLCRAMRGGLSHRPGILHLLLLHPRWLPASCVLTPAHKK